MARKITVRVRLERIRILPTNAFRIQSWSHHRSTRPIFRNIFANPLPYHDSMLLLGNLRSGTRFIEMRSINRGFSIEI